jgi:hypothetical protein
MIVYIFILLGSDLVTLIRKKKSINEVKFQDTPLPNYLHALKPIDCAELVYHEKNLRKYGVRNFDNQSLAVLQARIHRDQVMSPEMTKSEKLSR